MRYQRIDWKEGRRRDKKVPIILAEENNYTLFCDFNRVFLWGTIDKQNPVFGINVQSDV